MEVEAEERRLESKTVAQLRERCRKAGLSVAGRKADLIARLLDEADDRGGEAAEGPEAKQTTGKRKAREAPTTKKSKMKTKKKKKKKEKAESESEEDEVDEVDEEDEEMAEIDYIMEERGKGRSREYLVRWMDGAENTWLPESALRGTPALQEWKDALPPEDELEPLPRRQLESKVKKLAQMVMDSERMVVYTGAGISTSAGIPDFRGKNGLWVRGAPKRAVVDLTAIEPTPTHKVITELERLGKVHFIVSQNYDNLHIKSGFPKEKLAELHGNLFLEICTKCGKKYYRDFEVTKSTDEEESDEEEGETAHLTGRQCEEETCGGPLRDTIVHFGEGFEDDVFQSAVTKSEEADLSLCLGSKLSVTPACDMPFYARKRWRQRSSGAHNRKRSKTADEASTPKKETSSSREPQVAICNLQQTCKDSKADLVIHHPCDEVMTLLLEYVKELTAN